jgi:hypothetical protein
MIRSALVIEKRFDVWNGRISAYGFLTFQVNIYNTLHDASNSKHSVLTYPPIQLNEFICNSIK